MNNLFLVFDGSKTGAKVSTSARYQRGGAGFTSRPGAVGRRAQGRKIKTGRRQGRTVVR